VENYRLPKGEKERLELAATIGADGDQLLAAIDAAVEQPWLAQLPAIHVLREVWKAQYIKEDGQLRWRTEAAAQARAVVDAAQSALVREWTAIRAFIFVPPVTSSEQRLAYPNLSFD
jgi:hypothetical protein